MATPRMATTAFQSRIAGEDDIPAIEALMAHAIAVNMRAFLNADQIMAARETMGVDRRLIADQTYFLIETTDTGGATVLVGCGGWSGRRTLYGGDALVGRDDTFCDPAVDAARIRAMYTHPDWIRRGIGSLLLELGENAARAAGFRTIELGSTIPGEPLYCARGYEEYARDRHIGANGVENIIIRMRKAL